MCVCVCVSVCNLNQRVNMLTTTLCVAETLSPLTKVSMVIGNTASSCIQVSMYCTVCVFHGCYGVSHGFLGTNNMCG